MRWKLQTLNDLSDKVCFPNKMKDINLSMFNMITGINESKTFTKYIPCTCKCKLVKENVIQINGGITINVDVSVKNIIYARKIISGILVHAVVKIATIQQVLWLIQQLLVMKLQTWKLSQTTKKQKHFQQILMKKNIKL